MRDFTSDFRTPAWLLGQSQPQADLRVSDADRQSVADQLSKHFADGRLDQAEFDERLSQAMNAKTYRDLDGLLTDLPPTAAGGAAGLPPAGGTVTGRAAGSVPQRRIMRPLIFIAMGIIALSIASHAVAWAFGGWVWIALIVLIVMAFAKRSHHHRPPSDRYPS